jgi:RNA recognition motif-containing protein
LQFLAVQALAKTGSVLGEFPIRVSPSKTAIVPVNNSYLPRSNEERELVARTVFVGNIDRVVEREQLKDFFENLCGPVCKIRLLGDAQHNSKIAFVEFVTAESAKGALKLSGALLGTLPLRISPSKTPVRVESRRTAQDRPAVAASMAPSTVRSDVELDPSLLMAVAGLQLYPFTAAYQ